MFELLNLYYSSIVYAIAAVWFLTWNIFHVLHFILRVFISVFPLINSIMVEIYITMNNYNSYQG